MLSENGLQQRHARCWACSLHPSAAAQHSFDVRTALHGSVLSASRQASRRITNNEWLTFNGNLGQRKGLALPLRSTSVPPDRSAPSSRPAGKFCDGLPSGARWWSPTGARTPAGDEECSDQPIDSGTATPCGNADKWLRSCGSNVSRRSSSPKRRKCGRDPFVHKTYQ